jgi:hypothetical protein
MKDFSGALKFLLNATSIAPARFDPARVAAPAPAENVPARNSLRETGFCIEFSFQIPRIAERR